MFVVLHADGLHRLGRQAYAGAAGAFVTPAFGGQRGDEFAQLSGFRRCCEQGANDRKAQARPTIPYR